MMRKHLIRYVAILIATLAVLAAPLKARAATVEQITSFDSQVSVSHDDVATITETISYDFGDNQRHGIYRYIPTYYTDNQSHQYYLSFKLLDVTDDTGARLSYSLPRDSANAVIKIGDANKLITGVHTYKLRYQLWPLVTKESNGDLLALDITGNGWNVGIEQATASITWPDSTKPAKASCYTGSQGSTDANCTATAATNGYHFATTGPLGANEGMTVAVLFQSGAFTQYLQAGVKPPLSPWVKVALADGVVLLILALGWPLWLWLADRRKRHSQTVIAQYEAPDGLRPGELGLLDDHRADMTEITATLIDLAVRGYLKIDQISPKSFFSKAKYRFTKLKEPTKLEDYELTLFSALFAGSEVVELAAVSRTAMSAAVTTIKSTLKARLKAKGYYAKAKQPWTWVIIMTVATLPLIPVAWFLVPFVAIYAVVVGQLLHLTDLGASEWAKVEGFKLFLRVTEKDRLNFTDAPAKTPELFNQLLPYAVALKVEKEWAKQFEGMDLAQSTTWYGSSNGYLGPVLLASSLSSDFNGAIAAGFAAPSSSSGGGGGFSGGGFGGGGGGSW